MELIFGQSAVGDVGVHTSGEQALSFEDVFDGIADGTFAAAMVGDDVGFILDVLAGVGDGEGEAAVAHDGEVDNVIADECGFFGLEIFFLQNFAEGGEFVGRSLVDVLDLQVTGAEADGFRDALGDDSGLDAGEAGQ